MRSDFRVLGKLEVLQDDTPLDLGSPRQQTLLARLLISAPNPISVDRLAEDIWGEEAARDARHRLHVYLSRLRKALGPDGDRLRREGDAYALRLEDEELDAWRFERLAHEGRAAFERGDPETACSLLHRAMGMWRGPPFDGFADEAFARAHVTGLEELRLDALECRLWADLELGRHADVLGELHGLVADHPFRETFTEQLMLALYRCGRQADALRCYETARITLARELGIDPGPALQRMEAQILAHDPCLAAADASAAASRRLPQQRTTFVGRLKELGRAAELLEHSRLLTLTGPPGAGKTRLAVEIAARCEGTFRDGVYFVPLAAVDDPRLMADTVARTLGLSEVTGETALQGVEAFLRDRHALVVLDNFEQILPAARDLDELLASTERSKVLVTSRAPLRIYGEQEFAVPPLSLPPPDTRPDPVTANGFDAVALFVDRARAVDPEFSLTGDNVGAVVEIVTRLDGLPLAIELAASRVRALPPVDLLRLLTPRFALMADGPPSWGDRHHTMRNAIEWSYGFLDPDDAMVFRHLAVFRGGFTLEAATAATGLSELDTLASIDSLLSNSLLARTAETGRARYAMLELVREFALIELERAGERDRATRRHADYYGVLSRRIEPLLVHAPGDVEVRELHHEVDNLRAALQYSLDVGDPDLGLGIAGRLWRFWQSVDLLTEGRRWLEELLAQPGASPDLRAMGLTALAGLAYWQADRDEALARYADALEIYRSLGDQANVADTLYAMSLTASFNEDPREGERLAEEADAAFLELGSLEGQGKVIAAKGFARWKLGELPRALEDYRRAGDIARECNDPVFADTILIGVAALMSHLGDRRGALTVIRDVVEEADQLANTHITVWALDVMSSIAAPDHPTDAVRLAGAVDHWREEAGGGVQLDSLGLEDPRTAAVPALGAEAVDEVWRAAQSMSIEDAVQLALEVGSRITTA